MKKTRRNDLVMREAVFLVLYSAFNVILAREFNSTVSNVTATTITLTWYLPQDWQKNDITQYRLVITYADISINPRIDNPECSLLINRCTIKHLKPSTTYDVRVYIANGTYTIGGDFKIFTYPEQNRNELPWWWMYVVAPSVAGAVVVILIIFCIWKRRQPEMAADDLSNTRIMHLKSQTRIQDTAMQPTNLEGYQEPAMSSVELFSGQRQGYLPENSSSVQTLTETQPTLKRIGNVQCCRRRSPPSPPPTLPPLQCNDYVSMNAKEQSESTDLYVNSSDVECDTYVNMNRREDENSNHCNYTNTEDIDKMLGSARRMFPFL